MPHPTPGFYPPLPGQTIYAIGDIHGCAHLLKEVHARIDDEGPGGVEVYLGDYIDRGPDPAGVIDCLIERARIRETIFIRGNHEFFMQEFLAGRIESPPWFGGGAAETLRSYGVDVSMPGQADDDLRASLARRLPAAHQTFYELLRPSFTAGDYFFTHAGVRPEVPLEAQTAHDLMWIRQAFLTCPDPFEKIIVHGHTPVDDPEFLPNRIGIDTMAYASGRLTCLILDGDGARLLR